MELNVYHGDGGDKEYLLNGKRETDEAPLFKKRPFVSILGTGNYGRALAGRFRFAGSKFCMGSRNSSSLTFDDVEVTTYQDAAEKSDVIFFCIPPHAYEEVSGLVKNQVINKVVVDVSNLERKNDPSNALKLQSLLPHSHVVKALNTVSAYTLENMSYGASRETYICSNCDGSKEVVMQILREIGLTPIDHGLLSSAIILEKMPYQFFPGWGTAALITLGTLLPLWLYTYLRIFWYNQESVKKDLNDLPLFVSNRLIGWIMFWLLGLTYLPGMIAGFIQICRGTKYIRFPYWLDRWMRCRKQLGLICLLLAGIHGCMSCLVLGAGEAKYMLTRTRIPNTNITLFQLLDTDGQLSLLFATLSLALMSVVGITSLPSVNARMTWKEWDFIQRGLGFTSFVFGFIHVMVYVYHLWIPNYKYGWKAWQKHPRGNFPPGAWVMPMFPLFVIILKVILMLPGVSCYLNNIRRGRIGYRNENEVRKV